MLSAIANKGDSTISVREPVNWLPGDVIVIAPTGFVFARKHLDFKSFFAYEDERLTVVSVGADGKTVTFKKPLAFEHFAQKQVFDGVKIDEAA